MQSCCDAVFELQNLSSNPTMNEMNSVNIVGRLVVHRISYSIGELAAEKRLLRDVSFMLGNHEVCAVLGQSGAGKRWDVLAVFLAIGYYQLF